ncbi:MAG: biotin--[acetyl-CoA-carboxylase] ligase [Bacteroidota bacterium]|nr:biotin--[acetyl-CoA-carboxylase] ligase [Flammeovirgaceae bacterium]MCZ8071819.1 biotin--[acetyl-CoA-carboxylase] ligase [Cytophagales bacterium]
MYKILANTLFLGKNVVYVPECHSTSSLLLELTNKTNLPEGTIVITDNQTRGRGQRGNTWEAAPKMNLTFSILLKPTFLLVGEQFAITQAVSLALADYLRQRGAVPVKIKWPNDLMIGEQKVAGILIENTLAGNSIQQSVVGIGININQQAFEVPTATSLGLAMGKSFSLPHEWESLVEKLEQRYLQLKNSSKQSLEANYLEQLYRFGQRSLFEVDGRQVLGTIESVDANGRLLVAIDGETRAFALKEIRFL